MVLTQAQARAPARLTEQSAAASLRAIERLDEELFSRFRTVISVDDYLTRQVVSFQGNKHRAGYRWYKYKEAFSADLVEYVLWRQGLVAGKILDPFAGMGTTLFAASSKGLDGDGIELLPIGRELITSRLLLQRSFTTHHEQRLRQWSIDRPWEQSPPSWHLPDLRITRGAYPPETAEAVSRFVTASLGEPEEVQVGLRLALLCVLESISYTRKDGQYLRWDYRSGRRQRTKRFDKGNILDFGAAISGKIRQIVDDLSGSDDFLPNDSPSRGAIHLFAGSSLEILPQLPSEEYAAVITSPPYCNRYDYTRTYALELAMLGITEAGISELRQQMLTCTVENRDKDLLSLNSGWEQAFLAADRQELLQSVLAYLQAQREAGLLNNDGIPRMVRGYFYEMACVISECARVLRPGSPLVMVNDNVRYAGASISVDLILSSIAEALGFRIDEILILPKGKGNSSQQMGRHGRDVLRKSIYVWTRT